jgi:hypothetical protein
MRFDAHSSATGRIIRQSLIWHLYIGQTKLDILSLESLEHCTVFSLKVAVSVSHASSNFPSGDMKKSRCSYLQNSYELIVDTIQFHLFSNNISNST